MASLDKLGNPRRTAADNHLAISVWDHDTFHHLNDVIVSVFGLVNFVDNVSCDFAKHMESLRNGLVGD